MNPLQISAAQDIKNMIKVRTGTEKWSWWGLREGKDGFPWEKKASSALGYNTHSFCDTAQITSQVFVSPEPRGDDLPPLTTAKKISWRSTNGYIWLKYSLLELPGVLNWEVSRNFRGVDKLVTSIRGTGEASFTRDLCEGKELKQTVDYYLQ